MHTHKHTATCYIPMSNRHRHTHYAEKTNTQHLFGLSLLFVYALSASTGGRAKTTVGPRITDLVSSSLKRQVKQERKPNWTL